MIENMLFAGDARELIPKIPDNFIDCVVTSPPYYNLRDYDAGGEQQIGIEKTLDEYVYNIVYIFDLIKPKLKVTGNVFLNLGNSYDVATGDMLVETEVARTMKQHGWNLENRIIWIKPNCIPESNNRRFRCITEYVFFFTKNRKQHYFNLDAVRTPYAESTIKRLQYVNLKLDGSGRLRRVAGKAKGKIRSTEGREYDMIDSGVVANRMTPNPIGANPGDAWIFGTAVPGEDRGLHSAVFPEMLPFMCIKAGCPPNGLVFDPFVGSGTTCAVAKRLGRRYLGFDIDGEMIEHAQQRLDKITTIIMDNGTEVNVVSDGKHIIKETQPMLF